VFAPRCACGVVGAAWVPTGGAEVPGESRGWKSAGKPADLEDVLCLGTAGFVTGQILHRCRDRVMPRS
jgi:hypothetical protein